MTITNLKPEGESAIIIDGHVEFVTTEVLSAASSSGRPSGTAFIDALKDELVHKLGLELVVPKSHIVYACVMTPALNSHSHSWDFSVIAISRFS